MFANLLHTYNDVLRIKYKIAEHNKTFLRISIEACSIGLSKKTYQMSKKELMFAQA